MNKYDVLVLELKQIAGIRTEHEVMAEALVYGLVTARTSQLLEQKLLETNDLGLEIEKMCDLWDGHGFIAGALRAAQGSV